MHACNVIVNAFAAVVKWKTARPALRVPARSTAASAPVSTAAFSALAVGCFGAMDELTKNRVQANLRRWSSHGLESHNPDHVAAYLLARQ